MMIEHNRRTDIFWIKVGRNFEDNRKFQSFLLLLLDEKLSMLVRKENPERFYYKEFKSN